MQSGWGGAEVAGGRSERRITAAAEDRGDIWGERSISTVLEGSRSHHRGLTTREDTRLQPWDAVGRPRAGGPRGEDVVGLQVGLGREKGCSWKEGLTHGREQRANCGQQAGRNIGLWWIFVKVRYID